jgi:hypothetical protein
MAKRKNSFRGALPILLTVLALLALLLWFFTAVGSLKNGNNEENCRRQEDALRRAAVACYASEGVYPPSLDYLTEYYGVQIDTSRYSVFYQVFADNLMPDITVVEKRA